MKRAPTHWLFGVFGLGLFGVACAAPAERTHDEVTGGQSTGGTSNGTGGLRQASGGRVLEPFGGAPNGKPAVCGDGVRELNEVCDDGNVAGGDGCSGSCAVEQGWLCPEGGPCRSVYGTPACPTDSCQLGAACVIPASHTICECPDIPLEPCEPLVFLGLGYPPDANECAASALSADGTTIVGTCQHVVSSGGAIQSQTNSAISWRLGTDQRPQRLMPDSQYSTYGLLVSQDGTSAAGAQEDANKAWFGFIRGPSQLTRFDEEAGMFPTALSADGSVLVGTSGGLGFRYSADSGLTKVVYENYPLRLPLGLSADATISVGVVEDELGHSRAARWTLTDPVELLPVPAEATASEATAVSADGTVVVGTLWFGDQTQAVRWTSQGMQTIAGAQCAATAISADSRVALGNCPFSLWVWDEVHGERDLAVLLEELGVDLTDWSFNGPAGVSADGRVLAGTAQYTRPGALGVGMHAFVAWLPE